MRRVGFLLLDVYDRGASDGWKLFVPPRSADAAAGQDPHSVTR